MFATQNKNSQEPEIEDIPVHTMVEDLAEINNPGSTKKFDPVSESTVHKKTVDQTSLTAQQKSSPFLNQTPATQTPAPSKIESAKINSIQTVQPQAPVKVQTSNVTKSPTNGTKSPLGLIIAAILIIILLVGGGFYFWTTRHPQIVENVPVADTTPEPVPEPAPAPELFSTDKSNNLVIDLSSAESAKAAIKETADKFATTDITTPVEFTVVDDQNNPIKFSDFSSALGIAFSKSLSSNLTDNFSLFIYKDGPLTRLGIAIESRNATRLKTLLTAEEKKLPKALEPLLLSSDYTLTTKTFGSSTYASLAIRYTNITSPEDLSVDYTIAAKKLLIGTTKMTLRSIIDYINAQQTSTTPEVPAAADSATQTTNATSSATTDPQN